MDCIQGARVEHFAVTAVYIRNSEALGKIPRLVHHGIAQSRHTSTRGSADKTQVVFSDAAAADDADVQTSRLSAARITG